MRNQSWILRLITKTEKALETSFGDWVTKAISHFLRITSAIGSMLNTTRMLFPMTESKQPLQFGQRRRSDWSRRDSVRKLTMLQSRYHLPDRPKYKSSKSHLARSAGFYSFWGGSIVTVDNGDVEFDQTTPFGAADQSIVEEVTRTDTPQVVWQLDLTGENAYRGYRIPSLYPGVTWK